jgi:putative intracellular protease/amidase
VASRAMWLLETDLKEKVGVDFSRGEMWKSYMVEDRNLVTGQNPASAAVLANRLLEVLASRGPSVRNGPGKRAQEAGAIPQ